MYSNSDEKRIKVQYVGLLRQLTNCSEEELPMPAGSTLYSLIKLLGDKHGDRFRAEVFDSEKGDLRPGIVVLVNGALSTFQAPLKSGDQVVFLIALAGG